MWGRYFHREINWKEPFPTVWGTYISFPPQTILWGPSIVDTLPFYPFSARSKTYFIRFCTDRHLRLIDFRYAARIFSDMSIQTYTPNDVAAICMAVKKYSKNCIDGILLCTTDGNCVLLFDPNIIKMCSHNIPILYDVEYIDPPDETPFCIRDLQSSNFCILSGISNNPTHIELSDSVKDFDIIEYSSFQLFGQRQPNFFLHSEKIMQTYQSLQWNDTFLPVYGSFIEIPTNTLFWRGYDTQYPSITDRPVYFGEKSVAQQYAATSKTHALGLFGTTKPLKLLDIRFMKVLLTDLLQGFRGNVALKTTVAFGLCSFYHQLTLMQTLYAESIRLGKDPGYKLMASKYIQTDIEQPGVRVAETSNDGWVMAFLRELFDGIADGYIAPQMVTPYQVHTGMILHPELVVFNPMKSGIKQFRVDPQMDSVTVSDLIRRQFPSPITLSAYKMETKYIARGGGIYVPPIEAFNELLNRGNSEAIKQYKDAVKEGKRFRKKITFSM